MVVFGLRLKAPKDVLDSINLVEHTLTYRTLQQTDTLVAAVIKLVTRVIKGTSEKERHETSLFSETLIRQSVCVRSVIYPLKRLSNARRVSAPRFYL